jgi:hypothetical protein
MLYYLHMSLAALILLLFFVFIVFVYWMGGFAILYHLIRFGIGTLPKQFALIFFIGSLLLFCLFVVALMVSYPILTDLLQSYSSQPL